MFGTQSNGHNISAIRGNPAVPRGRTTAPAPAGSDRRGHPPRRATVEICHQPYRTVFPHPSNSSSTKFVTMDDLYQIVFMLICLVFASLGAGAMMAHYGYVAHLRRYIPYPWTKMEIIGGGEGRGMAEVCLNVSQSDHTTLSIERIEQTDGQADGRNKGGTDRRCSVPHSTLKDAIRMNKRPHETLGNWTRLKP